MKVTKENIDELNALLTIVVEKEDYQEEVEKTLSDYRKKANMPGFRKGMVPIGIIRKQYGMNVLVDVVNKAVNEGLYNFIEEEKLKILGNPLPKNDSEIKGDWSAPDTFEFVYEIGLSPKIEVKLSGKNKFDYTKVKVDESLIDRQVNDLTRRYGKLVAGEEIGEKDLVIGQLVELNDDDAIKEGGIMNSSTISMEFVKEEDVKKELIGKKAGDKIVVNPYSISRGGKDTAAMLGINEGQLEGISDKFQFTINEIRVMEPAELTQGLFDKLFGLANVSSEEEMRAKIKGDLEGMFEKDSEKILLRRISNKLIEQLDINLPDDFLKRWIKFSNKEPITLEQIEDDYSDYSRDLKWQLIKNAIFEENNLKIEHDEAIHFAEGLLVNQYSQYGLPIPEHEELHKTAHQLIHDEKEAQQIYGMLAEEKLINYFKETVKLNEKEVDYDEYIRIAQDPDA